MSEGMTMLKRARGLLRNFIISRRGNVAMMFGLALVPMTIAAGVGLDYARGTLVRSQMSDALDAAALAVGSTTGLTKDTAEALAQKYFDANYAGDKSNGKPIVTIGATGFNSTGSVKVDASYNLPTTLLKIVGKNTVPVSTSATVVWGQSKLWVALVLDNSLSMNEGGKTTKMDALKDASKKLLLKLKDAAAANGDVKVGIVPFTNVVNVNKTNVSKNWIHWGDWEAQPDNAKLDGVTDNTGPGSNCPFTNNSHGFRCQQNPTNGSSAVSTIPSSGAYSGYICPTIDNGAVNTSHHSRYYNGCWTSAATKTQTVTNTDTTPTTTKQQTCSQTGSGAISCTNQSGFPKTGTTTSSSTTTTTNGYTGDSTVTNPATQSAETYSDGTKSCTGSGNNRKCTWTRTYTQTKTQVTITKTGAGPWKHAWVVNNRSTWDGCIMDREQDYDVAKTAPVGSNTTGFPAANPTKCLPAKISSLGFNWTDLATQVDAMEPDYSTNQPIGVAHAWQMLTTGDPYGTPALPANTGRYIILFSDGLNTQNRWYDDLSQSATGSTRIDARLEKVCAAARADGVIIYSVYVNIGGAADSASMKKCASGDSKYYSLSSAAQIDAAFQDIGQQITNVRVSK